MTMWTCAPGSSETSLLFISASAFVLTSPHTLRAQPARTEGVPRFERNRELKPHIGLKQTPHNFGTVTIAVCWPNVTTMETANELEALNRSGSAFHCDRSAG